MDSILIVGLDTVIGSNLAAALPEGCAVAGVTRQPKFESIGSCKTLIERSTSLDAPRILADLRSDTVIYCGAGAVSCWDPSAGDAITRDEVRRAETWASAAAQCGAQFALISSDAIFANPWMFHEQSCESLCKSPQAEILRCVEERCRRANPGSLIVRTHVFGWSPPEVRNWIADLLVHPENALSIDPLRYATPILATDLAELLTYALSAGLTGTWHIAGSERVSHAGFVARLLDLFGLPTPGKAAHCLPAQGKSAFGRGETSLASREIRRALGIGVPLLSDGLERFAEQTRNGYCEKLHAACIPAPVLECHY